MEKIAPAYVGERGTVARARLRGHNDANGGKRIKGGEGELADSPRVDLCQDDAEST
jgi:hypothetical protein